jgi:predicted DNA-binding protein YlxM (UPF0122 family)
MSSSKGLRTKSLTVAFTISQWSARKYDKKISKEVEEQHQARDAGRYNKVLVAGEHLKQIQQIASKARTFHYEQTLPWSDTGERLITTENYMNYVSEMAKLKDEYETRVQEFIANYPEVVADARLRLNGMFVEADYPKQYEISAKFAFKTSFMPLPDTDDIRLDISQNEVDYIKTSVENAMIERLREAVKDTWKRIKDQLSHMKEKLSDKQAIFKNSLFDNLEELIELLPRLNVTDDPNIVAICDDMKKLVVNPDNVRNNYTLRNKTANEVNEVMNKFESFFQS